MNIFKDSTILITGGSGSWGNELTRKLIGFNPAKVIIYSRGEIAQVNMQRKFDNKRIEFVIGDVRDRDAVNRVFRHQIDYVFHLAALKHVPICENEPWEAVRTNIEGISNVIDAVIATGYTNKFILVSTDKAVDPVNVYGMTKGIAERMTIQANCRTIETDFIVIRAGNVLGTNGSLVPHLINQINNRNAITLTAANMTRFFLTLQEAIRLVFFATEQGTGGETFVMNMPSFRIQNIAELLAEHYGNSKTRIEITGAREGEKIHECLISQKEAKNTIRYNEDYYIVYPEIKTGRDHWKQFPTHDGTQPFQYVTSDFSLTSEDNLKDRDYLKQLLKNGGFLG